MAEPWFFEVLPDRPAPFPDECMSGYLLRLAQVNGFSSYWDFVSDLFPAWKKPQQIRMLHWEYPLEQWGRVPLRTQLPVAALNRLTVTAWVEKFRSPPDRSHSRYLSPGHFLKGVVRPELRVCSPCLQEKSYVRLVWRLAPVSVCVEHDCWLQHCCSRCGAELAAAEPGSQYLRCSVCGWDLRQLPLVPASQAALEQQRQLLPSLYFLLNPYTTLVQGVDDLALNEHGTFAQRIGLKFHYLRSQLECSIQDFARKLGVPHGLLSALEAGGQVPFPLYLTYLDALSQSWPALAALQVPADFIARIQVPRHLPLRRCPDPACASHLPQTPPRVVMLADLPERQAARFRCTDCGRRFTRAYDGALLTRPRRASIHPGDPPTVPKPVEEVALLTTWGLQGEDNRQIANRLGWGEKTVRMYWIALNLETQVHQAQQRRREKEKQERLADLKARLEQVLQPLLNQEEAISLRQLGRAMSYNSDFLHSYPALTAWAQALIQPHNDRVRQKQKETVTGQVLQALDALKESNRLVKAEEIAQNAGLHYAQLREDFPGLLPVIHQALSEHRAQFLELQRKDQLEQIDAAVSRLVAKGARLNFRVILQEAGLSVHGSKIPAIRDALTRWMGIFAPRD
jgi:transcriptional regulator with XRE-family HTH domain